MKSEYWGLRKVSEMHVMSMFCMWRRWVSSLFLFRMLQVFQFRILRERTSLGIKEIPYGFFQDEHFVYCGIGGFQFLDRIFDYGGESGEVE